MKNRHLICYALDVAGLVALIGAGFALVGALWFNGSVAEHLLFTAFGRCLMIGVGAFLVARALELSRVFSATRTSRPVFSPPASNVESLAERRRLPRAA